MSKTPKRKKNKVLKIVRKNNIWVTVVLCVIVATASGVFLTAFSSAFTTYIINSKILDEYDAVEYMAKIYDLNNVEDGENVYSVLNEEGRTYFISDKHGNIIYQNGENTTIYFLDIGAGHAVRVRHRFIS